MTKKFFTIIIIGIQLKLNAQVIPDTASKGKTITLDEVIISASKTEEKKSEVPYSIETIKSRDIEFSNPQTSADMLLNSGTVFVQKSQQGGGSPVMRGFEASRVLIVVDGVRMNNAIYRAGHLQDVITLDNAMLDHTEIIFGPSSTIYGSDALGGVMHFFTKQPSFGSEKMLIKANSFIRWSSANNEKTGHADVNLGWKRFASLTGITWSDFGDLRSGKNKDDDSDTLFLRNFYVQTINGMDSMIKNSNPYIQKFSGYRQYDITQKFSFKQNDKILHTLNLQYSNSSDIPRYDRLTDKSGGNLRFAEWYYGPQKRSLASLNSEFTSPCTIYDKLKTTLAWQIIGQDRISRRFKNANKTFQTEDVQVFSMNADLVKFIGPKHELRYGIEGVHNDVQSAAKAMNIVTGTESAAPTRYPDGGSAMTTFAAYISHKFRISEKMILSDGIRFSHCQLKSEFSDDTFYPFPFDKIEQNSNALTGNIGLVMKPAADWKISVSGASGFRTPNVDDLTKIFDSAPGTLIVANPDLKPEKAYNAELGIEKIFARKIKCSVAGWYTLLTDAMVVRDFKYSGQDSVLYNGVISRVQAVQNTDEAFITGLSGTLAVEINENISFTTTISYTYGRYHITANDTTVPLDHIAPPFGKTSLVYKKGKIQAEGYALYNGRKMLSDYSPSGEDNLQYATPGGMPGWVTFNLKASVRLTKILGIQAGIENILDTHYRYFASGISAAGRNFTATLRVNL